MHRSSTHVTIQELMSRLELLAFEESSLGSGEYWKPETMAGKEVMASLTAPENRTALRQWYKGLQGVELNPTAEQLRRTLEKATDECFH